MSCIGCKNLSGLSGMGYRYCKKEQHFGHIQDVRITPVWCPKPKKLTRCLSRLRKESDSANTLCL